MEIVRQRRHRVWGRPAIVNFVLGGSGAGLYLWSFLVEYFFRGSDIINYLLFKMLPPLLVGAGFFILTIEAGRPLKSYNLLRNVFSSWMSREVLAGSIFMVSSIMYLFVPHFLLEVTAAAAAAGLILSHGFIFYHARGMAYWNSPIMPIHFAISSFAMGFGALLFLAALHNQVPEPALLAAGGVIVVINIFVWLIYLHQSEVSHAESRSRHPVSLLSASKRGPLFPIVLLLLLLILSAFDQIMIFQVLLSIITGFVILAGGVRQKVGIILEANYLKRITIGEVKSAGGSLRNEPCLVQKDGFGVSP